MNNIKLSVKNMSFTNKDSGDIKVKINWSWIECYIIKAGKRRQINFKTQDFIRIGKIAEAGLTAFERKDLDL